MNWRTCSCSSGVISITSCSPPMIADQNIGSLRSSMIAGVRASRTSLTSTPPGRSLTIRYSRLGGISQEVCLNNALAVRHRSTSSAAALVRFIWPPGFRHQGSWIVMVKVRLTGRSYGSPSRGSNDARAEPKPSTRPSLRRRLDAEKPFQRRIASSTPSTAQRSACTARPTWPHIQLRAIKSTPDAEGCEVAREAFIKASEVADHREARAELDRAIRAADEAYEAELARAWTREHRMTVQ
jgi:hypothetical protein